MEKENKQEEENSVQKRQSITSKSWFKSVFSMVIILLVLTLFIYWRAVAGKIEIDNSSIDAPIINLAPLTTGTLSDIYVKVGDVITSNTPVAKVGDETITSKVDGIVVSVNHQEGQVFTTGMPVVSMINLTQERVVGKLDENKGLADIKVGDVASFTVDAFGGKLFKGVVDEISPISNQSGVVFNISDKREVKQFDIKVRFNIKDYPMLKEGMSAKITVYTN